MKKIRVWNRRWFSLYKLNSNLPLTFSFIQFYFSLLFHNLNIKFHKLDLGLFNPRKIEISNLTVFILGVWNAWFPAFLMIGNPTWSHAFTRFPGPSQKSHSYLFFYFVKNSFFFFSFGQFSKFFLFIFEENVVLKHSNPPTQKTDSKINFLETRRFDEFWRSF